MSHAPSPLSSFMWSSKKYLWELQIMKLLGTQFSPVSCHLLPLRPQYLPQCYQSMLVSLCVRQVSQLHNTTGKLYSIHLNLYTLGQQNGKTKYFTPNGTRHSWHLCTSYSLNEYQFDSASVVPNCLHFVKQVCPVSTDSASMVSVIRGSPRPKKKWEN
jgi:hypothetical protein